MTRKYTEPIHAYKVAQVLDAQPIPSEEGDLRSLMDTKLPHADQIKIGPGLRGSGPVEFSEHSAAIALCVNCVFQELTYDSLAWRGRP